MPEKSDEERKASPVIAVVAVVAIIVVLAGISLFVITPLARFVPFEMTVNSSENDHIDVFVSNVTTNTPLQNVQIGIYSYDQDTLLAGPLYTNESGIVLFETPNGFDNHFRVHGIYNGIKDTKNIDKRPIFFQIEDYLGTPLYTAILGGLGFCILGLIAYFKTDYFKSKRNKLGKGKDEL